MGVSAGTHQPQAKSVVGSLQGAVCEVSYSAENAAKLVNKSLGLGILHLDYHHMLTEARLKRRLYIELNKLSEVYPVPTDPITEPSALPE